VIFDFLGTLAAVREYSYEESMKKMYRSLTNDGFKMPYERFREVYDQVHHKYQRIRYEKLVEVTNAVWLSEALNQLGFVTKPDDETVKKAINIFFEDNLSSFRPRPCAYKTLKRLSDCYALALVSNFTYAPVIYAGLRKLRFSKFFNAVLVSEEVGWRKPHPKIFEEALKRLNKSVEQTVFVGDSPAEDIQGAKDVGMKVVFIPSQFFTVEDVKSASRQPDIILNSLCELPQILSQMETCLAK